MVIKSVEEIEESMMLRASVEAVVARVGDGRNPNMVGRLVIDV